VKELEEVASQALTNGFNSFCILVDGLDEINATEGAQVLGQAFDKIVTWVGPNAKLCVSSRPEPDFQALLTESPRLRLHQLLGLLLHGCCWVSCFETATS
jgi:hypothetical protein